jgi:hypothetical protein
VFGSFAIAALVLAQAERVPSVDEVRTQTRILMESMCGQQCDVVDVKIKTKRASPVGAVTPGFDEAPQARMVPSEVDLVLLFDSKLHAEYRKFVGERIKSRIGELGLPVLVTEQVKSFPAPPPPPQESLQPQPQPPPPQPVIIQPPAQPREDPPKAAAVDLQEALILKILEALPLLLIFAILAWLVLRVLKRMEEIGHRKTRIDEDVDDDKDSVTVMPEVIEERSQVTSQPGGMSLPPPVPER